MARRGEAAQIRADLSEQGLGRPPADAGNRVQPLQLGLKRAQARSNLGAHSLQTGVEEVDVRELLRDQEAVMRAELPGSACSSSGIFSRIRPRAHCASAVASAVPPTSAPSISRPDLPRMSVATDASLRLASLQHLLQPVHLARALVELRATFR